VTKETEELWGTHFNNRPYRLELVRLGDGDPFLAICGSKKGSHHTGGGIPISCLQSTYGICDLIDQIAQLSIADEGIERKVSSFAFRNRVFAAEVREFNNHLYYRVKIYANYFSKSGKIHFYKQHQLKPVGRGFFIQEMDFPLTSSGVENALKFSHKIRETVENRLVESLNEDYEDALSLIRNDQVIVGGELAWINSDNDLETVVLYKSLFVSMCEKLRELPMTSNQFAISMGLSPDVGANLLSPSSRYDPRFFQEGLILDRVLSGFGSLHYLVTQVPMEAFEESPTLAKLLEKDLSGKWPEWVSATFSNDEYSRGKWQSYHIAEFEIETLEGGLDLGVIPTLIQLRSSAVRLFDLRRHFDVDRSMAQDIEKLIMRFNAVIKETGYV
jgi:hypothetical protein